MKFHRFAVAVALGMGVLAAPAAWADSVKAGALTVSDAWVRASAPGQTNGAGYFEIVNKGTASDRLLSAHSAASERVELHMMAMHNGMAQMREIDGGLEVPAGGKVSLAPGGNHLMFMKLKAPFAAGAEVPATLVFEKAGEVAVKLKVQPLTYQPGKSGHDMGAMQHTPGMKH